MVEILIEFHTPRDLEKFLEAVIRGAAANKNKNRLDRLPEKLGGIYK